MKKQVKQNKKKQLDELLVFYLVDGGKKENKVNENLVKEVHSEVAGTTYELKINKRIYIGQLHIANKNNKYKC